MADLSGEHPCGFTWTHPETGIVLTCRKPKGHDEAHFVESDERAAEHPKDGPTRWPDCGCEEPHFGTREQGGCAGHPSKDEREWIDPDWTWNELEDAAVARLSAVGAERDRAHESYVCAEQEAKALEQQRDEARQESYDLRCALSEARQERDEAIRRLRLVEAPHEFPLDSEDQP